MNDKERNKSGGGVLGFPMFRSFQNPPYRLYLPGSLFQFAALSMQIVTGPMLMFRLSDSPALLGTMALISGLPMVFLSLFGGAWADRISKKWIVIAGFLAGSVVAIAVALMLANGIISADKPGSWWILIGAIFLMACIMGVMMPALQSLVAEIVSRDQLLNAVALNTMGMNILSFIAPYFAGFMIDTFDFHSVYYTMAGMYVLGAFFIAFLPGKEETRIESGNVMQEIRKGIQYIRKDSFILTILLYSLLATIFSMPYQQLLPIFVDEILAVGATGMGVLLSVSGAGAFVGSIALALLPNKKRGIILLASGIISGVGLVVFSFSTIWSLSISIMILVGLGQTLRMTIGSALLQTYSDPEYRGRVMSIFSMQWGLMSVCTFLSGIAAESLPVQWVLGSLALILITLSIMSIVFLPRIRRLD